MKPTKMLAAAIGLFASLTISAQAMAAQTNIAVAANFIGAARKSRRRSTPRPATRRS